MENGKRTHRLVVKIGEYEKDGETKSRWNDVGSVIEGKYGPYILLEKSFNPAGVDLDKRCTLVRMFSIDEESKNKSFNDDDDLPF